MSKRVVTSAIQGMTVGEVRRNLDVVRRRWRDMNDHVFFITDPLTSELSVQQFSFKFVRGHHFKRHQRQNECDRSTESDEPATKRRKK
jgi:hypothetical protein